MRALVVYESMFGNTRAIAEAVVAGLGAHLHVDLVEVGTAPPRVPPDVTLLVVGGPTHAFGLSRPGTRRSAREQGAAGPVDAGLRDWLAGLPAVDRPVVGASFATRITRPRVPGSAARSAGRALSRLGCRPLASVEDFWVHGTAGPLRDGETDRARRWGDALGASLTGTGPVPTRYHPGPGPKGLPATGPPSLTRDRGAAEIGIDNCSRSYRGPPRPSPYTP